MLLGFWEIGWAIGLKYTEGFTRLLPTIGTVVAMAAGIGFLGLALKALPVGTAYAVWTGIGTVGTAALGIYLFNEPATLLRLCCFTLILVGITALDLMNAVTVLKMAAQPFNTGRVGHVAADHKQVAPAAKEIGGVKDRFKFSQDV